MSQNSPELVYVAPVETPPSRRPPLGTIGLLGWLRKNLFSNWLNSLLTIIAFAAILLFLRELVVWTIQTAQWGVIVNNIKLINVGQYPSEAIWRIELSAAIMLFLSGIGLAIWGGVSRSFFLTVFVVLVFLVLVPLASQVIAPAPIRFLVYSDLNHGPMRFVGDEGDTVKIAIEPLNRPEYATDEDLFTGLIQNTLGVQRGITTSSRIKWSEIRSNASKPSDDSTSIDLTDYALTIRLQLLDAEQNVLKEVVSTPDDPNVAIEIDLPEDSWYIVRATLEGDGEAGYAWVRMDGVDIYRTKPSDIEKRTARYGELPELEDCHSPNAELACQVAERDLRFEGNRTVTNYLWLDLAPYLGTIAGPILIATMVLLAGYGLGYLTLRSDQYLKLLNRATVTAWIIWLPFSWILFGGVEALNMQIVPTRLWQGILLTMVLTIVSIVISIPLGVLLALGRRSDLPVVGTTCVLFIELVRGSPLITILYFSKHIVPYFSDALLGIDNVIRMLIGLTLFNAAYQAEIVRGGLQILPKGQLEAAQALGLNRLFTTIFIVLPQAIRAVIPAVMSQSVSLFKDTSLVSIVGLAELLRIVEFIVTGQQQYRPFVREAYLYVGIIYFIISFVMSSISRRLEETGSGAARR